MNTYVKITLKVDEINLALAIIEFFQRVQGGSRKHENTDYLRGGPQYLLRASRAYITITDLFAPTWKNPVSAPGRTSRQARQIHTVPNRVKSE